MAGKTTDRIKVPATLWPELQKLGINAADLLRQARLPLAVFTHQAAINTRQYFALWQAMEELSDDPAIGIKLASSLPTHKYPPGLLSAYYARNYRDALQRLGRYTRLCNPESMDIQETEEACFIEFTWAQDPRNEPSALIYAHMATLLEIGRRGTGVNIHAQRIELAQSKRDVSPHECYFGCRIDSGSPRNCLHLHKRDLERPFASYNEELLALLTPALDRQLAEHKPATLFSETIVWLLERRLGAGRPDMHALAREIGISERTLQRRLMQEGTHFQSLLTAVRRSQAHKLLTDTTLTFPEIALLLGYEDQSSFFRAFKLWENKTPSEWREDI